jgi:hypothetical protein
MLGIIRIFSGVCLLSVVLFAFGVIEADLLLAILAVTFCICPCALVCWDMMQDHPRIDVL